MAHSTSKFLVPVFQKLHACLTDRMMAHSNGETRQQMLAVLLQALARYSYQDGDTARNFFSMAQSQGFHFLPVHFYSPIPNTSTLPEETWSHRFDGIPGWTLNREGQLKLLEELARWAPEMASTPLDRRPADPPHQYFWNNSKFNGSDGVVYHSMIRYIKPRQILEIGCGYSTMVASRAVQLNGNTTLRCIEPFPMDELKQGMPGVETLFSTPLQEVSVSLFESLEENDILFFDGTHVSKVGSDVNYLVFEILPRLKPGVVVHIHDIFLPGDYPRHWVTDHHLFWNEQYLILAFLLFNDLFEILFAGHYIGAYERESFERAYPYLPAYGGCSFWIRRKR